MVARIAPDQRLYGHTLYENYRNTLEHNLGLALKLDEQTYTWVPGKLDVPSKVERARPRGLTDQELGEIESDAGWPPWLPATITRRTDGGRARWIVCLDALYCAARRAVRTLAEDASLQPSAQKVIADWYKDHMRMESEKQAATMSGTPVKVLTSHTAAGATCRAASEVSSGGDWGMPAPTNTEGKG